MKNTKWNPCHLYPFQPPLLPLEKWLTNGWCIFCNSFLLLSRSIVYWKKNQTKGQKQHHQTCPCLSFSRMCRCYQCLEIFQLIQKGPKAIHVHISACKYTKHYPLFSINHVVQVFHVQISTVTTPTIIAYFLPNTVQVSPKSLFTEWAIYIKGFIKPCPKLNGVWLTCFVPPNCWLS